MASNDESRQSTGSHPRVVTKADVHVRRSTPTLKERLMSSKNAPAESDAPPNSDDAHDLSSAEPVEDVVEPKASETTRRFWKRERSDASDAPRASKQAVQPTSSEAVEEDGASPDDVKPESPQNLKGSETAEKGSEITGLSSDSEEAEGSTEVGKDAVKDSKKKRLWPRVVLVIAAVLLAIAVMLACLFVWDRWYRYDDATDIQGQWYAAGSMVTVDVTDKVIVFNEETSYEYAIDPHAKTISYKLVNMEGEGRYWFDDGRKTLVIVDGEDFTAASTATDDLGRMIAAFFTQLTGGKVTHPKGDGIIVLTREPDEEARAAEAAKAEAAAAAAEAERKAAEEAAAAEAAAAASEEAAAAAAAAAEASGEGNADEPGKQEFANESVGVFE